MKLQARPLVSGPGSSLLFLLSLAGSSLDLMMIIMMIITVVTIKLNNYEKS